MFPYPVMDNEPHITQQTQQAQHYDSDSLTSNENVQGINKVVPLRAKAPDTYERWSKTPKPRGRQPRDPHGESVRFQCRDVDDIETHLRNYLEAPTIPAEHATLEFVFPASSAFMIYTADVKSSKKFGVDTDKSTFLHRQLDRTAISIIDALASDEDPKEQMRKQKAIAKVCIESCEKGDGFKYSFHNNWLSREDKACRFSYFCNDSTLNKGRAANEGAGMVGKAMRKPVYDCQGLVAIKFSASKQNLEVHYKHIPLHKTYAERAPPPRRESKRRKLMEVFDPESLPRSSQKDQLLGSEGKSRKAQRRSKATKSVTANTHGEWADIASSDSLQPIVDFPSIDSAATPEEPTASTSTPVRQRDTMSEPAAISPSGAIAPYPRKAHLSKPKKPPIPGTMSGSMQSGHLNWGGTPPLKANEPEPASKQATANLNLQQGITDVMSTATANIALSELELLKRKLEEAEERIRRLESEKASILPTAANTPTQHVSWPPPPGYPPSSHPQPSYTYPPIGPHYQPAQFLPPQHAFPQMPQSQDQRRLTPVPSSGPGTASKQHPFIIQKGTPSQPIGTKFVMYAPKSAKPPKNNSSEISAGSAATAEPTNISVN